MVPIGDIKAFLGEKFLGTGNCLTICDLPQDMVTAIQIITGAKGLGIAGSASRHADTAKVASLTPSSRPG